MSQTEASKFAEFHQKANDFKLYIAAQTVFRAEDLNPIFDDFIRDVKTELKNYKFPDYKVKFLEWVLVDLLDFVDTVKFQVGKKNTPIKVKYKNHLRGRFKNAFEKELVRYPFIFQERISINWKWDFRQIMVVMFLFQHLDGLESATATHDMSKLKDLIYQSNITKWDSTDIEGSFGDVKRLWNRIMETPNGQIENRDENPSNRENAAFAHIQKISNELNKLLKHV
jgi:hypothetical protein